MAEFLDEGPVIIRKGAGHDAVSLSVFAIRSFVEKFGHLYARRDLDSFLAQNHTPEIYTDILADPDSLVLIAETDEGLIAGYGIAGPCGLPVDAPGACDIEIKRLYVDRQFQRRGIGAELMDRLLAWCGERDCSALYLSVYAGNEGAQRFYQGYGFDKVKQYEYLVGEHRDPEFIFKRIVE